MTVRTRSWKLLAGRAAAIAAVIGLGVASPVAAQAAPSAKASSHVKVCPAPSHGYASCNAIRNDAKSAPALTTPPAGYSAADLRSAYNLTVPVQTSASKFVSNGQTVAIVDAYDAPYAENDLNVYRSQNNLAPCTTNNGCFRKVGQTGTNKLPRANGGWAQEISLDLDMASAICPLCNILLVEADSNSFANLGMAVGTAATLGGEAISNSYGGGDASDGSYGQYYNHPGHAITVSSGDSGYGAEYPASSAFVTAVGGTSLTKSGATYSERAWSGAGSGCSAYNAKPSWQHDTGCSGKRTVADVSAVADPNTGVAVYDSTKYQRSSGWMVFGGTSASAPIIAGVYALAGHTGVANPAATPYSAPSGSLHDVTSGSNGSCGGSYLCTSVSGYDGPTGLGTPNGVGAF
jgi:subtilase family serine protease